MNDLTQRLTVDQPVVMGGFEPTVEELRRRITELKYLLIKFTETSGGTELGFPLEDNVDLSAADFENSVGTVHVEGNLILDGNPVRCIADVDLATLKGTGRLALREKAGATPE